MVVPPDVAIRNGATGLKPLVSKTETPKKEAAGEKLGSLDCRSGGTVLINPETHVVDVMQHSVECDGTLDVSSETGMNELGRKLSWRRKLKMERTSLCQVEAAVEDVGYCHRGRENGTKSS